MPTGRGCSVFIRTCALPSTRHCRWRKEWKQVWIDFSVTHTQKLLDRINARIEQLDEPEVMVPIRRIGWRLHGFKIAAVAATLLILGNLWGYNYYFTGKTYTTKYGETKPLTLYDGSAVTLNANSRLELPTRYAWRRERSLFLEGEAYFQVRKQAPTAGNRKFTVKTDQVDIEVLGTHFNVLARPNHTTVLLDEEASDWSSGLPVAPF